MNQSENRCLACGAHPPDGKSWYDEYGYSVNFCSQKCAEAKVQSWDEEGDN